MMHAVAIPPFEHFYEQHRVEVLRLLRRRLGAEGADDAFQETFLRALRAPPRARGASARMGAHHRANVALDAHRRAKPTAELVESGPKTRGLRTKNWRR